MRPIDRVAVDRLRAVPAVAAAMRQKSHVRDTGRQSPPPRRRAEPRDGEPEGESGTTHVDVVA